MKKHEEYIESKRVAGAHFCLTEEHALNACKIAELEGEKSRLIEERESVQYRSQTYYAILTDIKQIESEIEERMKK